MKSNIYNWLSSFCACLYYYSAIVLPFISAHVDISKAPPALASFPLRSFLPPFSLSLLSILLLLIHPIHESLIESIENEPSLSVWNPLLEVLFSPIVASQVRSLLFRLCVHEFR